MPRAKVQAVSTELATERPRRERNYNLHPLDLQLCSDAAKKIRTAPLKLRCQQHRRENKFETHRECLKLGGDAANKNPAMGWNLHASDEAINKIYRNGAIL